MDILFILGLYILHIVICLGITKFAHSRGYDMFSGSVVSIPVFLSFIPILGIISIGISFMSVVIVNTMFGGRS